MTPTPSPSVLDSVDAVAGWTEAASNVVQILAIIVGAIWTNMLFVRHREKWPRATLEHLIQHWSLDDGRRVLRAVEKVTNTGPTLLRLSSRKTWVQQILPILPEPLEALESGTKQEAPWLTLGKPHETTAEENPPELEPGELEHFEHDFLIDPDAEVVQVYSHFQNPQRAKRWWEWWRKSGDNRGWTLTTVHRLDSSSPTENQSLKPTKEG